MTSGLKAGAVVAACDQDAGTCAMVVTGNCDGGAILTARSFSSDHGGGAEGEGGTQNDGATHTLGAQASSTGCLSDLVHDELPKSRTSWCTIT